MFNRESHGKVWFSAARCRFDVTLQDEFAWRENPNPLLRHVLKHTNQHKIWWRQQMATASALLAIYDGNSPVTGEFPAQRPVTRGFGVFCDLRLKKWLSKQSWGWWFETPLRYLWRHCNVIGTLPSYPFQIPMQCKHDDVIKWKHFHITGTLCGEFTGPGDFPTQRPVTRSFDFFYLRLDKRLSKQWWGWWFETPSWSLWRQCKGYPSETHLTLKSCEISFIHNIRLNRSIFSIFCTEHGSDAAVLCAEFRDNSVREGRSYRKRRCHEIWGWDEFRADILYCTWQLTEARNSGGHPILRSQQKPVIRADILYCAANRSPLFGRTSYIAQPTEARNLNLWRPHDNVIKWRHFPRHWPFVQGIHRSPVNSPHKGQRRGALMFSLIYTWTNSWLNKGDVGDLRRPRVHYAVTVMRALHFESKFMPFHSRQK